MKEVTRTERLEVAQYYLLGYIYRYGRRDRVGRCPIARVIACPGKSTAESDRHYIIIAKFV